MSEQSFQSASPHNQRPHVVDDPFNPETWVQRIEGVVNDPELVAKAGDDTEYLRFLQNNAIAQLDVSVSPEDPAIQARADNTQQSLNAYESYKFPQSQSSEIEHELNVLREERLSLLRSQTNPTRLASVRTRLAELEMARAALLFKGSNPPPKE